MKIYKAINAVMQECDAIGKGRRNNQQGYQFRGIDDVYMGINPLFAKHGIFNTLEVLDDQHIERPSKNGGVLITSILKIRYDFYADDGSKVSCTVIGEAMDSGDKASNKAMSVAHKYAILQLLCIPTEDPKDPENDSPQPTRARVQNSLNKVHSKLTEYQIPFGKFKGKTLDEVPEKDLLDYAQYIMEQPEFEKKATPAVRNFLDRVTAKTKA